MSDALDVIHGEHRAIAAVLHCFEHVLRDVRERDLKPDFALFEAVIDYIQNFPDRYHHPKEDDYLFAKLRERDPAISQTLDELQEQHRQGERLIAELRWKLDEWKENPDTGFGPFEKAALEYVEFERRHMGLEERRVMPAARKSLTENDWRGINAAFADNEDPIFGERPRSAYDKLFDKIVSLAPAPYGLGPRWEAKPAPKQESEFPTPHVRREVLNLPWV